MTARVSVVIAASVRDAPYLAVTLPHILAQARFTFAERLLVIDSRRSAQDALDRLRQIAADAAAAKLIDRVIELDTSDAARRAIRERYFQPGSLRDIEPTVYGALFAIDSAQHDTVAWIEPELLFHAPTGWLTQAMEALAPDVWLAETRGGPPPPSRLLRALASLRTVREGKTSGRHFVCDRRRLHRALRPVRSNARAFGAHLTNALERYEAFVEIVDGAWHVGPSSAVPPELAEWAAPLARAIERGDMPAIQRNGLLRLEDAATRSAWRHHLFPRGEPAQRVQRTATVLERGTSRGPAPVTVIIPIRDRAGADVRNSLASLAWQTAGRPAEIIIVSHGSDPAIDAELGVLAREAGATLIAVGSPTDPWCKPLALNTGIRATDPSVPLVMTMDGDMVLADNMLETAIAELHAEPRTIALCQSSDLPQGCALPAEPREILATFAELRARATVRATYGTGGIQVLPRSFLFDVRGYDEQMLWWGALDTDMVRRAQHAGFRVAWLTDRTSMLHQWHPRKHRVLHESNETSAARSAWLRNHEIMLESAGDIVRNREAWGAPLTSR